MKKHIAIVEDDPSIAFALQMNLEAEGYNAKVYADGSQALSALLTEPPDLVILDVMLPGMDGFRVCDRLRGEGLRIPVLFLTAKGLEDDRIRGLQVGGDDYMVKPVRLRELLARIKAMFRRQDWYRGETEQQSVMTFGENRVHFDAYEAYTPAGRIQLTDKECMVLKLLAKHEGKVISRDELLDKIWGEDRYPSPRTVDNLIARLRKHFEPDSRRPRHIQTQYGVGYLFVREPTD